MPEATDSDRHATGSPRCGREDCDEPSDYLLVMGERCAEHAIEDDPETVRFIQMMMPEASS